MRGFFALLLALAISGAGLVQAEPLNVDSILKDAQADFKKPENRKKVAAGLLITYSLAEFIFPGKQEPLSEKEIRQWNSFNDFVVNLKADDLDKALANDKLSADVRKELNFIFAKMTKIAEPLGISNSQFYRELAKSIAITSIATKVRPSPLPQSICDNFYVGWICKWL